MTPTAEILFKWQYEKNPVTRAVYRQIIGNRIDQALDSKEKTSAKRSA